MRIPPALTALFGTAGILTLVIGFELLPSGHELPPAPKPASTNAVRSPGAIAPRIIDTQQLIATALSRPLFNQDRKPDPVTDRSELTATGPTTDLPRLAGILISNEDRHAIFQQTADDPPVVVDEGGSIDGWKIMKITPVSISLTGPEGNKVLEPTFDPTAKAAAPAMPIAFPAENQMPAPNVARMPGPGGQPFDARRFQQEHGPPGMPFRPNMPRPMPTLPQRVGPGGNP